MNPTVRRTTQTLMRYDGRQLLRSATVRYALMLFLAVGLYAIYYGKSELSRRQSHIQAEAADEQARFADTTTLAKKLKGSFFFLGFTKLADFPPDPWQGVAVGQSDLFSQTYYVDFTMLYYKLFRAELTNPRKLHIGNFDLAFVLVYLLPLLIVVLSVNALSTERDGGTLPLLLTTGLTERQLIGAKLLLRFGIALTLAWGLTGVAVLLMPLPLDGRLMVWLTGTALYAGFWIALSGLLVSSRQSSAASALTGLVAWIGLTTLLPAALNVGLSGQFSPKARNELMEAARVAYGNLIDLDSVDTYRRFYRMRPDLRLRDTIRYVGKWDNPRRLHVVYSVVESNLKPLADRYFLQATNRAAKQMNWQWLAPPVAVNTLFNALAHADQPDQLGVVQQLIHYTDQVKEPFYQKFFRDKPIQPTDFAKLPGWTFQYATDWNRVWWSLGQLLAWTVVLGWLAYVRLQSGRESLKKRVVHRPQLSAAYPESS